MLVSDAFTMVSPSEPPQHRGKEVKYHQRKYPEYIQKLKARIIKKVTTSHKDAETCTLAFYPSLLPSVKDETSPEEVLIYWTIEIVSKQNHSAFW